MNKVRRISGQYMGMLHLLTVFAMLFSHGVLFGETLFIEVTETIDGKPCPPPSPAAEGIFNGLFEAGHILFNMQDGAAPLNPEELLRIAASGGARYVLEVSVSFTKSVLESDLSEISATARFSLFGVPGGDIVGSETLTDDNRGREKEVDLARLGFEMGGKIAAETGTFLERTRAPKK